MWFLIFLAFFISPTKIIAAVPSPSLPTADTNIPYVGAYYMPGLPLDSLISAASWRGIENLDPSRKPLLGYFDVDNPEAMDWEIKWALENGINFFIFDWYRCSNVTTTMCTGDNSVLGQPITLEKLAYTNSLHKSFLRSSFKNQMKFAIMLTNHQPQTLTFSDKNDLRNNLLPFIINNYLKQPNYLKINNRPVIFFFGTYFDSANPPNLSRYDSEAIQIIRTSITASGLGNPYLLAEDRYFTARKNEQAQFFKDTGYDHTFSYWPVVYSVNGKSVSGEKTISEDQALTGMKESYDWLKNNQVLPFIANANPMANGLNQPLWTISPPKYENLISYLKSNIIPNINSDLGKKVIIADAWNEYGEGHWIAPTHKYNFDYLKSIRKILSHQNNVPDYRLPAESNNGPYDSQYQSFLKKVKTPSQYQAEIYTFPHSQNYLIAGNTPTSHSQQFSFGGWFNPSVPQNDLFPLKKGTSFQFFLKQDGTGNCVLATDETTWYASGTAASLHFTFGQWNHLLCVYDGSKLTSYLNGNQVATSTAPVSGSTINPYSDILIGKDFTGSIGKLYFSKKALSASEVKTLYQNTLITSTPTPTSTPTTTPTLPPNPCSPSINKPLNCPCTVNIQCASLSCSLGKCVPKPTSTPTTTPTLPPNPCSPSINKPLNCPCTVNIQCASLTCSSGICVPKPTITPTPPPSSLCTQCPNSNSKSQGDANCDGIVDIFDYSLWYKEFTDGKYGASNKKTWGADFTGVGGICDGIVDTYDYSLWKNYFK